MSIWHRFLDWIGLRPKSGSRTYEISKSLQVTLSTIARHEGRPEHELLPDILAAGLSQYVTKDKLWNRWQSLSPREREVAALACLGPHQPRDRQTSRHLPRNRQSPPPTRHDEIRRHQPLAAAHAPAGMGFFRVGKPPAPPLPITYPKNLATLPTGYPQSIPAGYPAGTFDICPKPLFLGYG